MHYWSPLFAESSQPQGLAALGLDLKSFIFQLITFLIVLYLLRRFVFTKLSATLEKRRETLEKSLKQAKQTEVALNKANETAATIVKDAQAQADKTMSEARARAQAIIMESEQSGKQKAERIVSDVRKQLELEKENLSRQLRAELAGLVVAATEKVIQHKLDASQDKTIVDTAIKEIS